jgi:hypothetical protein
VTFDHVRIEHVGPIDKPIIALIISTEKSNAPITELSVQVDEKTFVLLINYLGSNEYLNEEREVNEFGIFKITKLVNGKTEIGFTTTRNESIHFFRDLLSQLDDKHPSQLVKEIKKV